MSSGSARCPTRPAPVVPDVPVTVATTGHSWQREGLALEVLWPGSAQDAIVATAREDGSGEGDAANDCSVVVAATWPDGTRMVSLADLEPAAQEQVAAAGPGRADVVKVAHHGSRRQHEELYDLLGADLALITVAGLHLRAPTGDVLQLLREDGTAVIRHRLSTALSCFPRRIQPRLALSAPPDRTCRSPSSEELP